MVGALLRFSFVALVLVPVRADQEDHSHDSVSLFQQNPYLDQSEIPKVPAAKTEPFIIGLRRESVPIYRQGKIASFKTSYSGVLHVGTPAQEFRVVFDTGSANIVLPAAECGSEACLVEDRRRFNMSTSSSALAVQASGRPVRRGERSDQVTIGFGTGEITGEFTRDRVCFGSPPRAERTSGSGMDLVSSFEAMTPAPVEEDEKDELCVEMSVILAIEMSTQPFKTFRFDGILGLALDALAMSKEFSAFEMIMGTGVPHRHFGVFLSEGDEGEQSEIAMGGVDPKRFLEPLSWASVAMPELGYWQVPILSVRIDGVELDFCKDGTCRGVVDTGTSHLGIPAPFDFEVATLLTREAGETLDCRLVEAPEVVIEVPGYNLTLHPFNYMRRLPLREGVSVSSQQGVYVPSNETNKTLDSPSSADAVIVNRTTDNESSTIGSNSSPSLENSSVSVDNASIATTSSIAADGTAESVEISDEEIRRFCRPRLIPVRLPEPLGPKLFILGEPVLHRYYTVYDWEHRRVGFSLANTRRNTMDPSEITDRRGVLPEEVDMLLMQERMAVSRDRAPRGELQDEVMLVQVELKVTVRSRVRRQ